MAIFKNTASQKVAVYAFDPTTTAGSDPSKTGDAANITAEISLDGAASAATNDTNPTELDATDHPGVYLFDLTQAETNAEMIVVSPVSSTSDVLLDPVVIYTTPADPATATALATVDTVVDTISTNVSALNDVSAADVNAQCDTAISDAALATAASIAALNDISTSDVNAQVVDVLRTDTVSELASVPAAAPDLHSMVQFIYQKMRNAETATATAATVKQDDGTTVGTSTLSDDGTTFTKGKYS